MSASLLAGLRVVSTALNLPGPAACARLREFGAAVTKIEPPTGDPFEEFCPSWYRRLHEGTAVERLDLKSSTGIKAFHALLANADLLVTAQRPSALARLGLDPASLASRHGRLCHVAITGHPAPNEDVPGHDLTYLAMHGLIAPPAMPPTLFADMAGAELPEGTAVLHDGVGMLRRGDLCLVVYQKAARIERTRWLFDSIDNVLARTGGDIMGFLIVLPTADPPDGPTREENLARMRQIGPRGVYDEAKRYAEALTMAYHRQQGVDTCIVRIFNTYGPRMRPHDGRAIPTFMRQALENKPITVFGDGSQTRSFCYVDDLIRGLYALATSDEHLPVNIGNPHEMTLLELAEAVVRVTGSKSEIVFEALPVDDPQVRQPDITRARQVLGWEPEVELEDGLRRLLAATAPEGAPAP